MTDQLIPVFVGSISNQTTLLCNARELHAFLSVKRDFSNWIKNRVTEYGFLIDTDYITVENLTPPNLANSKSRARKVIDYHLTLDTAKELAMVERNEKDRQVRRYFIECEKQLMQKTPQAKQPPAEPLSHKDMSNLKRLVWMMTASMRFESSWNAGVWHCLRSVTGRPSPQAFSVEDLPALSEECRRIIKITSKVNAVVSDFEKDVIRKVVRKRGEFEPLLSEMNQKLVELQQQESEGLLALGKLEESCIGQLSSRM